MNTTPHDHRGDMPNEVFIVAAHNAITSLGWKVIHISKGGIIAAVAPGEEIKIVKTEQGINISVKGGDSQSAQQNISALKLALDHALQTLHPEMVEGQYRHLSQSFENDSVLKEKPSNDLVSLLIPSKRFFFTPLIIYANVLIFILMVIKGMDFFSPDGEMMVAWGANFKPDTLNGEWWRLITACFLHFGILHLALNMYALLYIGVMLEPLVGKWRFITAYLLTGVASSALSLYWNNLGASAGASGAVFGMYGMFIAMLVGGVVHKSFQKELLTSMAGFVVINLTFGFAESGIDNAGHIGGLISGIIIGFIMVPGLKKPKSIALNIAAYIGALLIGLGSGWFSYNYSTDITHDYEVLLQEFSKNEEAAVKAVYELQRASNVEEASNIISTRILPNWEKNLDVTKRLDALELPEYLDKRSKVIQEYTKLQVKSYDLRLKKINENTGAYDNAIEKTDEEISAMLKQAEADAKKAAQENP